MRPNADSPLYSFCLTSQQDARTPSQSHWFGTGNIAISEMWGNRDAVYANLAVAGNVPSRKDRADDGKGGDVAIMFKDTS